MAARQADARLVRAKAGYLPRLDLTEAWQRGNQPVFVFGSLLAQRRFTADNFAVAALNRPDAVGNLQTAATIEQALYDPAVRAGVRAATLGREAAAITQVVVAQDLAVAVTKAYGGVLSAQAAIGAAAAAIDAATADLELARNRRDAGVVTDADVLQLEVHLARARDRQIRNRADVAIAQARLNQALGTPLDTVYLLDDAPDSAALANTAVAALEAAAMEQRPDLKLLGVQERLSAAALAGARAAFLPRVSANAAWEANGGTFGSRSSSWMVGAVARVNLFRGFADKAALAESRELQAQRALERERAQTAVRLEVREAAARADAARASETVARAAVAQAREGHRIVRDRYESGLADVTALLRAAESVQQAEAWHAAARIEVVIAAATLTRAAGAQ